MFDRLKNLIQGEKAEQKFPDREHKVYAAEDGVTIYPPRGPRQFLPWNELLRVEIHTRLLSSGSETVYWVLFGSSGGMAIPSQPPAAKASKNACGKAPSRSRASQ